ncbi:hypothetical protein K6W36_15580 [Acetobacter senegalensis]|uniref:hypothetical protein n=1 Tax=Acetobacter senegalensis TaxID=446692 RepID=UPI001EDC2A38|nr:hypothetical protein [Acetobacter senegalensis]MCG4261977.1 hypothetical protein [Acetobacter senegalensis]
MLQWSEECGLWVASQSCVITNKEGIYPSLSETMATAVGRTLFLKIFVNVRLVMENTDDLEGSKNG